jgi:hypothetical protein
MVVMFANIFQLPHLLQPLIHGFRPEITIKTASVPGLASLVGLRYALKYGVSNIVRPNSLVPGRSRDRTNEVR